VRAREDIRGDLMRARQRLSKLLLRYDVRYEDTGSAWTARHRAWLGKLDLGETGAQATLLDYLGAIDALVVRRDALEATISQLVPDSPWAQTIARLRCLRGVDTLSAVGLCAEIGDFERFEHPGRLMSYLGLVPSENSSGERRRQGAITKTGSRHARRLLVEAAWHYRRAPAKGQALKRRQEGQPANVIAISWKAQQRLHRTWRRLDSERGKRRTIVAVAAARELRGFPISERPCRSSPSAALSSAFLAASRHCSAGEGRCVVHVSAGSSQSRAGHVARPLLLGPALRRLSLSAGASRHSTS